MDLELYQGLALRTLNSELNKIQMKNNAMFGLSAEFGELVDIFKKHFFQEHRLNIEDCTKELGDILWYLALSCECMDSSLDKMVPKSTWVVGSRCNEKDLMLTVKNILYLLPLNFSSYPSFYAQVRTLSIELSKIAFFLDTTLQDSASLNVEKLRKRYGAKFTAMRSRNRK